LLNDINGISAVLSSRKKRGSRRDLRFVVFREETILRFSL